MSGCEYCGFVSPDCNCFCKKCKAELVFCPADWPFNPDYWICSNCDSTYTFEEDNANKPEAG